MKWLDRLGLSASLLCAIHCALVPFLGLIGVPVALDLLAVNASHETEHLFLVFGTLAFAALTFAIGTYKHRDPHSWKWMFFALVSGVSSVVFHETLEVNKYLHAAPLILVALFLMQAHRVNMKAWHYHKGGSKACECKHHPAPPEK